MPGVCTQRFEAKNGTVVPFWSSEVVDNQRSSLHPPGCFVPFCSISFSEHWPTRSMRFRPLYQRASAATAASLWLDVQLSKGWYPAALSVSSIIPGIVSWLNQEARALTSGTSP